MPETAAPYIRVEPTPLEIRQSALYAAQTLNLGTAEGLIKASALIAAFLSGDDAAPADDKPATRKPRAAKADEPKVEETKPSEPAAGFDADGNEVTSLHVKEAMKAWMERNPAKGQEELIAILGAPKVGEIDPSNYEAVIAKLSADAGEKRSVFDD